MRLAPVEVEDAGALPLCRRCPESRTPHFRVACPSWSVGLRGSGEDLPLRRRLGGSPTDSPTRVCWPVKLTSARARDTVPTPVDGVDSPTASGTRLRNP